MRTPTKTAFIFLCAATTILSTVIPANAASKTPAPKPSISGSARGGFRGGFGGANSPAFAKYTACLAKAGVKLPSFGGGRRFGTPGSRPSGAPNFQQGSPRPRPSFSLSPAQQKAMASCASLRPSFGGFGNQGSNGGNGFNGSNGTAGTAPKTGASAAFIACLNTKGIPVQTAADVAGLDNQNTKVIAALKARAGK